MAKKAQKRVDTRQQHKVFISHATHDKWIATVLCEKLEDIGVGTFRDDRDIIGGDSIPEVVLREIGSCDEIVVLLTPESVNRQWILVEIGIALGAGHRIVPLIYHIDAEQIPDIIRNNRGFDLNNLDEYLADLEQRVNSK